MGENVKNSFQNKFVLPVIAHFPQTKLAKRHAREKNRIVFSLHLQSHLQSHLHLSSRSDNAQPTATESKTIDPKAATPCASPVMLLLLDSIELISYSNNVKEPL